MDLQGKQSQNDIFRPYDIMSQKKTTLGRTVSQVLTKQPYLIT